MKVEIYSREAMEKRLQEGKLYDTAVICFYDPPSSRTPADYAPINYDKKCSAEYSIAVHDIDIEVLPEYGLTYDTYLPEAKLLAFYIKTAVDCDLDIVCQCEYGQSRSAACAAAIKEYYEHDGISIFADYRYYPNQLIFNKVLDALKTVNGAEDVAHPVETGRCAIPLFHGTRLYALTTTDEEREHFHAACKQVISFARNLFSDTAINASALKEYQLSKNQLFLDSVTMQQKNSFYQHGDFYLTSGYPRAITFTKHAGGEFGQWAYHQCLGFKDFDIRLDQQTTDAVKFVMEEYPKYHDSEKVVLVYRNVSFEDLLTEGGEPYLLQCEDNSPNEAINVARVTALYKSNVTDHSGRQINFRLVNPEAYTAQLIHQKDLKAGFAAFTKVTDIERYVREKRLGI